MKFKAYKKIPALHKPEATGILYGTVYIQEKIDGANASIWMDEDGIHCGSRSRDLTAQNDSFNGFLEYVNSHDGIKKYLSDNPTHRLYGEWLVKHTIGYKELSYKNFYLFDIEDESGNRLDINYVYKVAEEHDIKTAHLFGRFENPTLEMIKSHAGNSVLGDKGEGVVIKNLEFVNAFGDTTHAKYVTQDFKEDNAITFGGNNRNSETYNEMYYVNKFLTLSRVQKVKQKLESAEGQQGMKLIPRMMETVYHDLITEEAYTIAKEMAKSGNTFDFKAFENFCKRKTKSIYIELLDGDISIAHKMNADIWDK